MSSTLNKKVAYLDKNLNKDKLYEFYQTESTWQMKKSSINIFDIFQKEVIHEKLKQLYIFI